MLGRTLQGQYAGLVTRAIAFFIDVAIVTICLIALNWIVNATANLFGMSLQDCQSNTSLLLRWFCFILRYGVIAITLAFYPVYLLFFWILTGQTPGKYLMGVKIVRIDGKRMTLGRSIKRLLGYVVDLWTLGLGFLWIAVDDRRQGLHDRIGGTYVIYAWEARQNETIIERLRRLLRDRSTSS